MNDSADDSVVDADGAAGDGAGVTAEDSDQDAAAAATADAETVETADAEPDAADAADAGDTQESDDLEALREKVEETYDFDEFGPSDMAQMSAQEWDAAFDPDTWITGDELLDRVADELKSRIATRDVFGILERVEEDGEPRLVVYSDEGYAIIHPTGQVRGQGTVLRDVEPIVALCSMDSYDVPEPPDDWSLPDPENVPQGTGEFGNLMLQIVAGAQLVGGTALVGAWILLGVETIVAPVMGLLFIVGGLFLFSTVANARLSDRFRSEEYRERLRALRAAEERPEFVPIEEDADTLEREG